MESLQDLRWRFDDEGVEYTVCHAINPDVIEDPVALRYAHEARIAINRVKEYVESKTEEE